MVIPDHSGHQSWSSWRTEQQPLTDMVLPTASEVWFGKSLKSIPESIWIIISAGRVFQLQSPGCERHAANPHALWVQDPNGGSEVRE